jgi:adenosylcobinamide-GDP ribazoletransferase
VSPAVPHAVAAAAALGLTIVLTGAIHLDGFLDGCDAFFAAAAPERRHAILKDPRCGSFALAGLLVAGSFWYAGLVSLPAADYPAVLAFAGALARAAALANALVVPPARPAGTVSPMLAARPPGAPLVATWILLALAAFGLAPPLGPLLVPAALGAALLAGRWIAGRLGGGLTGDAYGFLIVVLEVGTICALSGFLAR